MCHTGPETSDDTRYANSGQTVEGPNVEASKLPLARWAVNFSELGVKQVRLQFRRDKSDKGLKEWLWPAVFSFLSGTSEWTPIYSINMQKAVFRMHLAELAKHPRHSHQLKLDGDTYMLRR